MSEASVTAQIAIIQGYADDAITAAESAITSLQDMDFPYVSIGPIPYDPPEWPDVVVPSIPSEVSIGSAPAVIDVTSPTLPTKPDLKTFDDPTMITPVIPSAPEKETPVWEDVDLGELLEAEIPTAPTVNIDLISLDVTIPKLNILAPTNWTFELDPNILISDDPMIQVALLRLKNNILYGGTGLSADVESAIWNRDIERNEQQLRDSMDKVSSAWAKKGFSLPDGLLANSISAIQLEYFNRNIDRSREIAIKQAELEQSNIFKSLELCVNLSTKLIDETIRYATLSLQCQEDVAKFSNEYIELQIKTYNSMLDEYKSRVQVYQALISANQAKISMYREQIAAEVARLDWLKAHRGVPAEVLYDRETGEALDPELRALEDAVTRAEADVAWCRGLVVACGEAIKGRPFDEVVAAQGPRPTVSDLIDRMEETRGVRGA